MHDLFDMLCGRYLQNEDELTALLSQYENNTVIFSDGTVWRFDIAKLTAPDLAGYTQITAVNVTELYQNMKALKADSEELSIVNRQLQVMYDEMSDRIREQEALAMKLRLHDQIGTCLITIRRLLSKNSYDDVKSQLNALQLAVNTLIRSAYAPVDDENTFTYTQRQADILGILIEITGNFPTDGTQNMLVNRAIRECMTNTARHAHGGRVQVVMEQNDLGCRVTVTNDGRPPTGPVTEGGGLSSLRRSVEAAGGQMRIEARPAFRLILEFFREEQVL